MFDFLKTSAPGLKVVIVGCGKVGMALTKQLSEEGHDVTIIDKNANTVNTLAGQFDVMGLVGSGSSYSTLREAGVKEADLFIAVTGSDELNLLCCTIAKQVGEDCAAIARVRDPDYAHETSYLRDKLGLAMIINPEYEAAMEMSRILSLPTALEVNSFAHGQASMVKIRVPEDSVICGKNVAEVNKMVDTPFLITAVEREGEVYIPGGYFTIMAGDILSYVAPRRGTTKFLEAIGYKSNKVSDCMIIGGGKAAYYLGYSLINRGIKVKIIEQSRERCEQLSILLPKAIIINGDGVDQELLKEEGIEYVESFVPLTGIDEVNVLLTLHARTVSKAKVITKVNRIGFNEALNNLELGSVIYPKFLTAEAIVAYVRARRNSINSSNIETLYHMYDSKVEAIEFIVNESKLAGVPLKDLKVKDNLLISFINHRGKIIIPSGNDCIENGDTVMIVTTHHGFMDIEDILE